MIPGGLELTQLAGRSNPIFLEGRLLPLADVEARALGLKDADVVQALVKSSGSDDLSLVLRGRLIELTRSFQSAVLWTAGQTVSLRVQGGPDGPWSLLPLTQGAALASSLPLPLFSRAANLLFRPPGMPALEQLYRPGGLEALLRGLPRTDVQDQWRGLQLSMAQLTPQALGQAMAAAFFPEALLASGMPMGQDGPKLLLRRLIALLGQNRDGDTENVSSRIKGLQGAVDDLESAQLQAVQAQTQSELLMRLVLPFRDAEPVELVFRRAPRSDANVPLLTVNVHSRNEELGEIWLKTQLHIGDRVDLTMWALRQELVLQARQRSVELGLQLADAGLGMGNFQVVHGPRPASPSDWAPSGRGMVVDVTA